jgi:hypothetical protein
MTFKVVELRNDGSQSPDKPGSFEISFLNFSEAEIGYSTLTGGRYEKISSSSLLNIFLRVFFY